ncbi:MAG: endonuclease MutS2, partial [Deltaproteobacteria bacterium]|nr:endonuclease MutS2 [Deltaproteobacteria bacterium]
MPPIATRQTQEQLDWFALCERLAWHCAGNEAREYWLSPPFFGSRGEVEEALALAGEAQALLEQGEAPPLSGLYDLRRHLGRLQLQASLEAPELLEVSSTLGCIRRLRSFLDAHGHSAPRLAALAEQLVPLRSLEQSIEESFEPSGKLADNASPELGALRRRVLSLHDGITSSMEQLVLELDRQGHLQDSWYTLRQERYVVPLRSGARGHVRGIVHDVSGSGQTLFVEPEQM